MNTVADSVERKLRTRVAERQESWRVPGLFGAVVRGGELAWSAGVVFARRPDKVAGIALANTSAVADPGELALDLACTVLDDDPADPEPWRPGHGAPPELEGVPGRWWSADSPFVFSVAAGRLEARLDPHPAGKPPAVFVREGGLVPDGVRPEQGEALRLVRDESGTVVKMSWATYPFTREPQTFGSG